MFVFSWSDRAKTKKGTHGHGQQGGDHLWGESGAGAVIMGLNDNGKIQLKIK